MTGLPLFDEPPPFDRNRLARTLAELANERVFIGTSSWKYEGWIGQIYSREKYMVRGRFSRTRFERLCIEEYAQTFPVVCGDFSFYQFPSDAFWAGLFTTAPPTLQFAFKVPEEVTCRTFPSHPRYGPRAGMRNGTFLDHALFTAAFLDALKPYRERISLLIFEFGTFSKKSYAGVEEFCAELDAFLSQLPDDWRYAVEIRNEEFLHPLYFDTLRRHAVAHVFNAWTRMPPLHRQMAMADAWTADFTVVRALLRVGRPYETAVKIFAPYAEIQDENPPARAALREAVSRARKKREAAYLFINNRLEGNAPVTIDAVVHDGVSPEDD